MSILRTVLVVVAPIIAGPGWSVGIPLVIHDEREQRQRERDGKALEERDGMGQYHGIRWWYGMGGLETLRLCRMS